MDGAIRYRYCTLLAVFEFHWGDLGGPSDHSQDGTLAMALEPPPVDEPPKPPIPGEYPLPFEVSVSLTAEGETYRAPYSFTDFYGKVRMSVRWRGNFREASAVGAITSPDASYEINTMMGNGSANIGSSSSHSMSIYRN
ncbi:MAG: hypothetical protein R3240_01390 [Gammaproteobacteria bacterium]|nr:hypothetical protein [Gammaproteobacteria bacterium]